MNAITPRQPAAQAVIEASQLHHYRRTMRDVGKSPFDRAEACERLIDMGGISDAGEARRILNRLFPAKFRSARHG